MLMTPMTPKVMARPMAASSRTDDAQRPYQRSCAAPQNISRVWMDESADSAAALTSGSVAFCAIASIRFCASWSPRAFSVDRREPFGGRRCVAGDEDRGDGELRASATRGSVSLAELALSAGSALASRVLNTSSAAARRLSGSGLARVREPSAPSMALRSALLTRTFLNGGVAAIARAGLGVDDLAVGRPVGDDASAGSNSRRLSLSASRIAAPCGGASAASSAIAFWVSGNLSVRNRASVSSRASARAAPARRRATSATMSEARNASALGGRRAAIGPRSARFEGTLPREGRGRGRCDRDGQAVSRRTCRSSR